MSIKVTKQEQKEHAALAAALQEHSERVEQEFASLLVVLGAVTASLNYAIKARNEVAKKAAAFAEGVHDRLSDEWDEKSERWQEGDAGQEAQSLIEEWDSVTVDEIQEVEIVKPELEGDIGWEEFRDLPHEPS